MIKIQHKTSHLISRTQITVSDYFIDACMRFATICVFVIIGGTGILLSGCDNACKALNDQICRCATTETEQQSCLNKISALDEQRSEGFSAKEEAICADLAETCTCNAVQNGDYQACGMSVESLQATTENNP